MARTTKCPERRKLDALLADEAKVTEAMRALDLEAQAQDAALVAAREELAQAVEADGLNLDGSAGSERQRKAHDALTRAEARSGSQVRGARHEGLRRKRDRIVSERVAFVHDNLGVLAADLGREASDVRERLDVLLAAVADVNAEWTRLGSAWLALETAGNLQRQMRLDIPAFPVKVGDVVDPVPRVLADVIGAAA